MDADDEATTFKLLASLAQVQRMLSLRALQLSRDPGFSETTHEFSIDAPDTQRDRPNETGDMLAEVRRRGLFLLSGYVDTTPEGHTGAAWLFDVTGSEPRGLRVSRRVVLYPLGREDVIERMPERDFAGWSDLADGLPPLIEELLAAPLPEREEPSTPRGA